MADKEKDLTNDSYVQQMNNTISQQQKQIDMLSQQMYPSKGTDLVAENSKIIPLNQYSTPVVDGGISGRDYYSTTPMSFVAPNIEGRQRAAASNLRDFKTVEYFKDNFDSLIGSIKNIPGVNDEVYNNLVNNAYGAINELADKKDLENYTRYIKELSSAIGGSWGGNALNQSYTDYTNKRKEIDDKSNAFDATKTGGYSPEMREYANSVLNNNFKGVTLNKETGRVEYSSFQLPNLIEYQNVTKQVEDLLNGWKEDGTLQSDVNGNFKWIRDVPGSMGMVSRDSVSESDLRNYALKYLESAGLGSYMEQQSTINTTNTLNRLASAESQGADKETMLKSMIDNFKRNYNNPLEMTGHIIDAVEKGVKSGKTYSELLLGNGALALKGIMRSKFEDDTIGLPASKHSYTKDTYNNYADHQAQADIEIAKQQRLKDLGLGTYFDDGKGNGSGSGSGSGSGDFSEGAETFAISVHRDGFMFNDSYTITNLNKFKDESDNAYTSAYNTLIDLKRRSNQGDKGISSENLERAEESLKQADDEVKYYKEVMSNITTNTSNVLKAKGYNIDSAYNNFAKYTNSINIQNRKNGLGNLNFPNKTKFKEMVTELTGLIVGNKTSNLYRTEEYLNLLKKYKIQTGEGRGVLTEYVDGISRNLTNTVKTMKEGDKNRLLNPQLDASYLIAEGSNAKNTALKSFESSMTITDKLLKKSPNTFRALDKKGNASDFLSATASYLNVPLEEVHDLIDWENTSMNPLITKDFIVSKKLGNKGVQYLATLALNKSSEKYKKYESKLEDIRKNGNLKMVVTPDAVNAETSNKELNMRYKALFNDLASRGVTDHSAEVIRSVGLGWANTNGYSKDFDKYTFYDLNPENKDLREVNVNGSKYGVSAIYSDAINKGVTDKDFYVSRKDPNKPDSGYYNQILVKENVTGNLRWVGVNEINSSGGNSSKNSQYSRVIANTPQDLLGYLATADLYQGLAIQQANTPKKANGGSLRGASSYNMDTKYRSAASKIRGVESSNNYQLKGHIAVGAYQVVPSQHATKIKELYGMNMNQYLNSNETQDKYFEYLAKSYDRFLSGSKGIRLLNIIKTANPSATYDDALGVVHFWGEGNVDKLLSGKYSVDSKIPYKHKGVTKYNPSLRYHVQKLKRGY